MSGSARIILIVIGALLVLNGLANIVDDARVLTDDLTSIPAGAGFIIPGGPGVSNRRIVALLRKQQNHPDHISCGNEYSTDH